MDTYGIINLTELDRMIESRKKSLSVDSHSSAIRLERISALTKIKELCLTLPLADTSFMAAQQLKSHVPLPFPEPFKYHSFEDYMNQFIKPDKP